MMNYKCHQYVILTHKNLVSDLNIFVDMIWTTSVQQCQRYCTSLL